MTVSRSIQGGALSLPAALLAALAASASASVATTQAGRSLTAHATQGSAAEAPVGRDFDALGGSGEDYTEATAPEDAAAATAPFSVFAFGPDAAPEPAAAFEAFGPTAAAPLGVRTNGGYGAAPPTHAEAPLAGAFPVVDALGSSDYDYTEATTPEVAAASPEVNFAFGPSAAPAPAEFEAFAPLGARTVGGYGAAPPLEAEAPVPDSMFDDSFGMDYEPAEAPIESANVRIVHVYHDCGCTAAAPGPVASASRAAPQPGVNVDYDEFPDDGTFGFDDAVAPEDYSDAPAAAPVEAAADAPALAPASDYDTFDQELERAEARESEAATEDYADGPTSVPVSDGEADAPAAAPLSPEVREEEREMEEAEQRVVEDEEAAAEEGFERRERKKEARMRAAGASDADIEAEERKDEAEFGAREDEAEEAADEELRREERRVEARAGQREPKA